MVVVYNDHRLTLDISFVDSMLNFVVLEFHISFLTLYGVCICKKKTNNSWLVWVKMFIIWISNKYKTCTTLSEVFMQKFRSFKERAYRCWFVCMSFWFCFLFFVILVWSFVSLEVIFLVAHHFSNLFRWKKYLDNRKNDFLFVW